MTDTQQQAVGNSTKTVFVGCKLPHGYVLEVGKRGHDGYKAVTLKGTNDTKIIGGYGITEVDEAFMTNWLKKTGSRLVPVRKKLIFIQGDLESAQAKSVDEAGRKTGFERLSPKDSLPKGVKQYNAKD